MIVTINWWRKFYNFFFFHSQCNVCPRQYFYLAFLTSPAYWSDKLKLKNYVIIWKWWYFQRMINKSKVVAMKYSLIKVSTILKLLYILDHILDHVCICLKYMCSLSHFHCFYLHIMEILLPYSLFLLSMFASFWL